MEKVYRKPAVKTSFMHLFNVVNNPKQPTHIWDFWKQVIFKRDHEKGNLIFFFFFLHPVTFYGRNFERQKYLELVSSLFELQDILIKIPFLVLLFESGDCGKRRKKTTKDWINRGKKHFSKFLRCFLLVKYEK